MVSSNQRRPAFSSLNCCFTTGTENIPICSLCNAYLDSVNDEPVQHSTPECSLSFHRSCLAVYIQERVSPFQPIAFCPYCNVGIGEYVYSEKSTTENLLDTFDGAAAATDSAIQSQMVLLPAVSTNMADGDFYRRDVVVIQTFDYERILSFLQTGCIVRFVPWDTLRDNDAYAKSVLEDLKRFEHTNALYVHSEDRYVWEMVPVNVANPSVFLGFDFVNAGYLEVEQHYQHPISGENITRWNLIPLTPSHASWLLPQMFKDGLNPATGKCDSLPLAREVFSQFMPLQEFLDRCARQGTKDISDVELVRVYPKEIALYYANEQVNPMYSGRRTQLHIQLEYPQYATQSMVKHGGLSAVGIRAYATRDGLLQSSNESDEEFTVNLLLTLGLHEDEAATVELLDRAYLDEFYEDYHGFGHQICFNQPECLPGGNIMASISKT